MGGIGNDDLNGEAGYDTADYGALNGAITLQAQGVVNKGANGVDQLVAVERIDGNAAYAAQNTIDASTGTSGSSASIVANLSTNRLDVNLSFGTLHFDVFNFDNVKGTSGNDVITGNDRNNILVGANAFDHEPGDDEVDVLTGLGGQDTFVVGDASIAYYQDAIFNDYGDDAYAQILDFQTGFDTLQLKGGIGDYVFDSQSIFLDNGNDIIDSGDDLIVQVSTSFSTADLTFV